MQLAIAGLGLIGGSIALAARERLGARVVGWDPDPGAVAAAERLGVIADGAGSLASAVAGADAVLAAAPVGALPALVAELLAQASEGCVVTDVGSAKGSLCEAVSDPRFVGGHPLAGAETSGVANARADMFDGAVWYLTPSAASSRAALERVRELVSGLGAEPVEVGAGEHDRLMATVSHLPHVFANVLVGQLAGLDAAARPGPSFRDATRVAGSNSAIWSGIYLENRVALGAAVDDAIARLEQVRALLVSADSVALARWCEQAAADRSRLER